MRQGQDKAVLRRVTLEWSDGRVECLDGSDAVRWWVAVNGIVRLHLLSNPCSPARRNFGGNWKLLAGARTNLPEGCGPTGPTGPRGSDEADWGPRGANGPSGPSETGHGEEEK